MRRKKKEERDEETEKMISSQDDYSDIVLLPQPSTPSMNQAFVKTTDKMPPTKQGLVTSNPQYIVTWRTTVCDIMCTSYTERVKKDIVLPSKFRNDIGLTATLPYSTG